MASNKKLQITSSNRSNITCIVFFLLPFLNKGPSEVNAASDALILKLLLNLQYSCSLLELQYRKWIVIFCSKADADKETSSIKETFNNPTGPPELEC
jgi:hypothetical protein